MHLGPQNGVFAACQTKIRRLDSPDNISRFLGHAKDGRHDVGGRQKGYHTGVDDAQVAHAVDLQLGVNDTALVAGGHLAASGGVVQRGGVVAHPILHVGIAGDVGAGDNLDGAQGGDGVGGPDAARKGQGLLEEGDVERVGQEGRRRVGHVKGAVGHGLDVAARVRVLQPHDERARVPEEFHGRGAVACQVCVEQRLVLGVAGEDLGRRVAGQVLRAVLGGGVGGDAGRGVGVGR